MVINSKRKQKESDIRNYWWGFGDYTHRYFVGFGHHQNEIGIP